MTKEKSTNEARDFIVNGLLDQQLDRARNNREEAILAYADKLTRTPEDINAEDVRSLRQQGLNDLAIHDLCAVVAYFAFVNRIADGLGVELE